MGSPMQACIAMPVGPPAPEGLLELVYFLSAAGLLSLATWGL